MGETMERELEAARRKRDYTSEEVVMSLSVDKIEKERINILRLGKFKFDLEKFKSGASMIDVEVGNRFYCLQLTKDYVGVSEITEEDTGFSTLPDESFRDTNKFKKKVSEILGIDWE